MERCRSIRSLGELCGAPATAEFVQGAYRIVVCARCARQFEVMVSDGRLTGAVVPLPAKEEE